MLDSLTSVKKLSLALGVAGVSALVGLPALAQSPNMTNESQRFRESQEIRMSNEGMKILCTVTPINSRCEGSPYYTGSSTPAVPATSPDGTTAPTQTLPSESDVPSAPGQPAPSPMGGSPDGSMGSPNGSMNSPSDGTNTPGSNGNTAPEGSSGPSGTTAPTQNLPSESPGK